MQAVTQQIKRTIRRSITEQMSKPKKIAESPKHSKKTLHNSKKTAIPYFSSRRQSHVILFTLYLEVFEIVRSSKKACNPFKWLNNQIILLRQCNNVQSFILFYHTGFYTNLLAYKFCHSSTHSHSNILNCILITAE